MTIDRARLKDLTRTDLYRVLDEFQSERDAAKRTATKAIEDRNILIAENKMLRERAERAEKRWDELMADPVMRAIKEATMMAVARTA